MKKKSFAAWIFGSKFVNFLVVIFITIIVCILCSLGVFEKFEQKFYDSLLGFKKTTTERQEILLVDIDDLALEQMGDWPWTRDKVADSLILMRELGAKTAVFDIEYLSPSQKSVDFSLYENILSDPQKNADSLKNLFVDNDDYFSRSIQFFGNSWLTVNSGNLAVEYTEEELEYAKKRFLVPIEDENDFLTKKHCAKSYSDFSPALHIFAKSAKGAGYTNVKIDSDGSRRRIQLLIKYADGALPQLSFAPALNILKPEKIKITKNFIILENCINPDFTESKEDAKNKLKTIKIPIDKNGTMLINWLKKPFAATKTITYEDGESEIVMDEENTSFKHCSIFNIWYLSQIEKDIYSSLEHFYTFEKSCEELNSLLKQADDIKEYKNYILSCMNGFDKEGNAINGGVSDEVFNEYFGLRTSFFENLAYFANGSNFEDIVRTFPSVRERAESFYDNLSLFLDYFGEMQNMFSGKFCILGNTGSGTTDLGSTPFNNSYPNVGTHANVYNTIMTGEFIYPVEWYFGAAIAALLSLFAFGFNSNRKVLIQSLLGISVIILVILIPVLLMYLFRLYIPLTTPILVTLVSFVTVTVLRFRSSEKDRKFITGAFSQCLSKDVVDEIIKDPSKLVLGGKNYNMTAIFTDIQNFSGFSELLTADELVALLNYYLTNMSEIIISEKGTVDKYEGDAIVAFVGAPVSMEDHAIRACSVALKMKKAEKKMNSEILEIVKNGVKPDEMPENLFSAFNIMVKNKRTIFTRIGLNSGEIVAGFMGSENKKNYTVMGSNVNLASRLEGVNKQYHTSGILLSEATQKLLDERFVLRSLDRVQVVNVKTPIRLYELLAFKSDCDEKFLNYIKLWEQTMRIFEGGNYDSALNMFKKLLTVHPNDSVCKYYITLLEKFFIQGKIPTPHDDFGVAFNAENPIDMDKSWIGTEKEIKGTFTLLQK